jgi:hypothetical protein
MKILNRIYDRKISLISLGIICLLLLVVFSSSTAAESSESGGKIADFTEGGHLETDFGVNFLAEWWYLNGEAELVAQNGEKRDAAFFVVLAHQESPYICSPDGTQLSQLLTFYGFYFDDGTTVSNYIDTYVPQVNVGNYIALNTPFVDYTYPDGLKRFYGSALPGYNLNYVFDNIEMDLFFQTNADKTVDQATEPLNFVTYEYPYGTLHGSIILDNKKYIVTHAKGYMDHMIPMSSGPWPMDIHGWNCIGVTTKNYAMIAYSIRGLEEGYNDYSYKHLTLLNKHNGNVIAEYSADEIDILEADWIDEKEFNRKRPSTVVLSASDLIVTINAENVISFDRSNPQTATGFIDFMAYQPNGAELQYKGNSEKGSAFYEYLVTDMGVTFPN